MAVRKRGRRWEAYVYNPQTRGKTSAGTYDTKGEAREAEAQKRREVRQSQPTTCKGFADIWIDEYPRRRESTNRLYRELIPQLVREFGDRRLSDVTRPEARRWALEHRAGAKAASAMFSDAVRDGLCDRNPFIGLRLTQSRGRKDLIVPTPDEIAKLAELAGQVHGTYGRQVYANLILVAAYTGARPGELYGLRWTDIDFAGETLLIERQFNPKVGGITPTKNGEARTPYLNPIAAQALKATPRLREDCVFTAARGGRFSQRVQHFYWTPVKAAAGHPEWDFYSLRHFYGTHLANLGVGAPQIAKALGHNDGGQLALERYIHVTEKDAREKIRAAFGGNVRRLDEVRGQSGGGQA